MAWIPTPSRGCDVLALRLDPVEGFVLSRIDGQTDLDQLALVTGLTAVRLEAILETLVREGAVEAPHGAPSAGAPVEAGSAEASPRQLFETRLHQLPEDPSGLRALPSSGALSFA
jgi:hypothetical protein